MHSQPTSASPSQSLSSPSHASSAGNVALAHSPQRPSLQLCVPGSHSPSDVPQERVSPLMHSHPSSMSPAQSLSSPSQTSSAGNVALAHSPQRPSLQLCVPGSHSPSDVPQERVSPLMHSHPSSMSPAQSLSSPSQTSAAGKLALAQSSQRPSLHVCVPGSHSPSDVPHERVSPLMHSQPSSMSPSQSLSAPSQTSALALPPEQVPHLPSVHS